MEQSRHPSKEKSKKKSFQIILVLLPIVIAIYCVAWFVARGFYDDQLVLALEDLNNQGLDVQCDRRELGGFPFRFEHRCEGLRLMRADGLTLSAKALRSVSPIWNPQFAIIELDGDVIISLQEEPIISLVTQAFRTSLRIGNQELQRLSLDLSGLTLRFEGRLWQAMRDVNALSHAQMITMDRFVAHIAQEPFVTFADDATIAAKPDQIELSFSIVNGWSGGTEADDTAIAVGEVTNDSGKTMPINTSFSLLTSLSLERFHPFWEEHFRQWLHNGAMIDPFLLRLGVGTSLLRAKGQGSVSEEGLLNGMAELRLIEMQQLVQHMSVAMGVDLSPLLLVAMMGAKREQIEGQTQLTYDVHIEKGQLRVQNIPVLRVPAIF
jgi:hypothetical protein